MRDRCPLPVILLLALAPGCAALNGDRPLPVQVVDAETKRPIPGAGVQVVYPFAQPTLSSGGASGATGRDGVARLWAVPSDQAGVTVEVTALGYMGPEEKSLTAEAVRTVEPAHFFESVDRRPAAVVLEMYAEPRPSIELVIKAGYRGLIHADVQAQEEAGATPGQRQFSYEVPPLGVVTIVGPPIFKRVFAPDFHARYDDGRPLNRNAKDGEIGFWWVRNDGTMQTFFVGTQQEFEDIRRADDKPSSGLPRSGGQGGGGGGRRGGGRRGGGGGGGGMMPGG